MLWSFLTYTMLLLVAVTFLLWIGILLVKPIISIFCGEEEQNIKRGKLAHLCEIIKVYGNKIVWILGVLLLLLIFSCFLLSHYENTVHHRIVYGDDTVLGHRVALYEMGKVNAWTGRRSFALYVDGKALLNFNTIASDEEMKVQCHIDDAKQYDITLGRYVYLAGKFESIYGGEFRFSFSADFDHLFYYECDEFTVWDEELLFHETVLHQEETAKGHKLVIYPKGEKNPNTQEQTMVIQVDGRDTVSYEAYCPHDDLSHLSCETIDSVYLCKIYLNMCKDEKMKESYYFTFSPDFMIFDPLYKNYSYKILDPKVKIGSVTSNKVN